MYESRSLRARDVASSHRNASASRRRSHPYSTRSGEPRPIQFWDLRISIVRPSGWLPVSGDWDGDGRDGVGVYNKLSGAMFLANDATVGGAAATFIPSDLGVFVTTGGAGLLPVAGSWRGLAAAGVGTWSGFDGVFLLASVLEPGVNPQDIAVFLVTDPIRGGPFRTPEYLPIVGA